MSVNKVEHHLEQYGIKYFIPVSILLYIIGALIFNTYLVRLGLAEFELLQLRYMIVGLMFSIITAVPVSIFYLVVKILEKKKKVKKQKNKQKKKTEYSYKKSLSKLIFLLPWAFFYAITLFPLIPAGFGGAKPIVARLIGEKNIIKKINDIIAYESGIPAEKLPFEPLSEVSDLAAGANVKILDRSSSRVLLILTKDLYLSSTSSLAKKLIESGEVEDMENFDTKNFVDKPLIISEKIDGITLTLYEPPKITTKEDLVMAAKIMVEQPEKADKISNVISEDLPGTGKKIADALTKIRPQIKNNDNLGNTAEQDEILAKNLGDEIDKAVDSTIDSQFLKFREEIFTLAGNLKTKEWSNSKDKEGRLKLVKQISRELETNFSEAWEILDKKGSYLILGQNDLEFPLKIQRIFQGAVNAKQIVEDLNITEIDNSAQNIFQDTKTALFKILENSSQENTEGNKKFVAQLLVNELNKSAAKYRNFWSDSLYLQKGITDEKYLENLNLIFTNSTSWENLGENFAKFWTKLLNQDELTKPTENTEKPSEGVESPEDTTSENVDSSPADSSSTEKEATTENQATETDNEAEKGNSVEETQPEVAEPEVTDTENVKDESENSTNSEDTLPQTDTKTEEPTEVKETDNSSEIPNLPTETNETQSLDSSATLETPSTADSAKTTESEADTVSTN